MNYKRNRLFTAIKSVDDQVVTHKAFHMLRLGVQASKNDVLKKRINLNRKMALRTFINWKESVNYQRKVREIETIIRNRRQEKVVH